MPGVSLLRQASSCQPYALHQLKSHTYLTSKLSLSRFYIANRSFVKDSPKKGYHLWTQRASVEKDKAARQLLSHVSRFIIAWNGVIFQLAAIKVTQTTCIVDCGVEYRSCEPQLPASLACIAIYAIYVFHSQSYCILDSAAIVIGNR